MVAGMVSFLHIARNVVYRRRICLCSAAVRSLSIRSSSSTTSSTSTTNNVTPDENDSITVRLVSINDVYDLTKLPRLATFIQSLGKQKANLNNINDLSNNSDDYDRSITPSAVTLNGDFLSPSALSSIDNGRGHVAALRAAGVTHVSLGNHEADLQLNVLKERLGELAQRGRIVTLNSNVSGLGRHTREMDIVGSNCGRIKIALLGLLSDERDMFRDGTFRGLSIGSIKEKYEMMLGKVSLMRIADCVIPLTHQSMNADIELAKWMLQLMTNDKGNNQTEGVILGGHEHVKIHEHVSNEQEYTGNSAIDFMLRLASRYGRKTSSVQIVKSGMDAERAAIVDLRFNPTTRTLESVDVSFEELDERHQPCPIVSSIVNRHLSVLEELQDFIVFDKNTMLSGYFTDPDTGKDLQLSSEFTRYEQTTVGALFCTAIRSELGVDVCIINGAPIKGSKTYTDGTMSYDDLRNELPFPLKMIVVEMTRKQLKEAVEYSRTNVEKGKSAVALEDGRIERRGYLQVDFDYWKQQTDEEGGYNEDDILTVALPRNLLKGFCKIQPLMDLHKELEAKKALPIDDDYIKAIDLIVRYCCKDRWTSIAEQFSFTDLDLNNDGVLCREEIRQGIKAILGGEEPSEDLVDSMLEAVDDNADGSIDELEFNKILSKIRSKS